jgi:hypothetical protein
MSGRRDSRRLPLHFTLSKSHHIILTRKYKNMMF